MLCRVPSACPFDTLVVTAPNTLAAQAYLVELCDRLQQQAGSSCGPQKQLEVLVVSDPAGTRVGSGGGTLNALAQLSQLNEGSWCLAEHCTLMIHSGGDSQRSPTQSVCGKAWSSLNSVSSSSASHIAQRANTPLDLLLQHFYTLFAQLRQGSLVIACCDVMLLLDATECNWKPLNSSAGGSVAGLAIAADVSYAPQHGVYVLAPKADSSNHHTEGSSSSSSKSSSKSATLSSVTQYLQKPSAQQAAAAGAVSSAGTVAIDTGVVVFSGAAATALQQLACSPAFAGCCSSAIDAQTSQAAAAQPLRLELYADIMLALRTGTANSSSINGNSSSFDAYLAACGARSSDDVALTCARKELYSALNGYSLDALLLDRDVATFAHLGSTAELMQMLTLQMPAFIEPYALTHSLAGEAATIGTGAVLEHCVLHTANWHIGDGALVSGLRRWGNATSELAVPRGMEISLGDAAQGHVFTCFAVADPIKAHYTGTAAAVCGAPWSTFMSTRSATANDIWPGIAKHERTLWRFCYMLVITYCEWCATLLPTYSSSNSAPSSNEQEVLRALQWLGCTRSNSSSSSSSTALDWSAYLTAERLSLCDVLAVADPSAEFAWRRELAATIVADSFTNASSAVTAATAATVDAVTSTSSDDGTHASAAAASSWDVMAIATTSLQQCTATTVLLSTLLHTALADTTMINVPPSNPQCKQQTVATSATAATSNATTAVDHCALALNALLVVHEQLSYCKGQNAAAADTATATGGTGTDTDAGADVQPQSSLKATTVHTAQSLLHSRVLIVLADASSCDDSLCTVENLAAAAVPHPTGMWIVQCSAIVLAVLNAAVDEEQHSDAPGVTAYTVNGAVCAVKLNTAAVERALLLAQADELSQCYTAYDSGATAVKATTASQSASRKLDTLVQRLTATTDVGKVAMATGSIQARTVELPADTAVQNSTSLLPEAATTAAVAAAALDHAQKLHSKRFTALQHELAVLDSAAAAASPNCWSQSLAAIACRLQLAAAQATVALAISSSCGSSSSKAGKATGPGQHCDWIRAMAGAELCQDNTGKLLVVHVPQCSNNMCLLSDNI
eukprot:15012-Heterococcus_DN1.PRE.2